MKKHIKSKGIMIQGTASSVGKSILCTALCRIFTQDGYNVNPFKSQNMSLNSFITPEGHEMGRAQVMQAEAAKKVPSSKMNPILLKPTSDRKSQVIINGKVHKDMDAVDYFAFKAGLKSKIADIYNELSNNSDIVVIEGAGSPAEINLNKEDFVNMGMAEIADAPVLLVGDIDKGGVFAALAGTMMLLDEKDKRRVKGVIINKFRGSYEILEPGLRMLEDIINVPVLGVVPYFRLNIEDEDSVSEWLYSKDDDKRAIDIAVIKLPYMSNHTDFNCLKLYSDVSVRFVEKVEAIGYPDLLIIPGTKNTIHDLKWLFESGLALAIKQLHVRGCKIFGICGGFQMLGIEIHDPCKVESEDGFCKGLGMLNVETFFAKEKTTTITEGIDRIFNCRVKGYEIHMGETRALENVEAFISVKSRNDTYKAGIDGAVSTDKTVFGTYLHGIFDSSEFTNRFLNTIRVEKGYPEMENNVQNYWDYKEEQYDKLAEIVRNSLDMERIYDILEAGAYD
ncbi:MAG: cobyric acid synthase [Bacillota bacterium]